MTFHKRYHKVSIAEFGFKSAGHEGPPDFEKKLSSVPGMSSFHSHLQNYNKLDKTLAMDVIFLNEHPASYMQCELELSDLRL